MKGGAVYVTCCLVVFILPLVSGQGDACDNMFSSARVAGDRVTRRAVRRRDVLLNIAHGNGRTEKCSFLRSVLARPGRGSCAPRLSRTCPVPARSALARRIGVLPDGCTTSPLLCNSSLAYRTIDGSCNNLMHPRWGQAGSQERRFLQNAYDDGRGTPRIRGCNNQRLPSARTVSNTIHRAGPQIEFERSLTLLVMQMGQFLVHDLVLTEVLTRDDGSPLACCTTDSNNPKCNPIGIPQDDTHFPQGSCMNFARSNANTDCSSVRQVLNSQTSYFDLSTVYGSSDEEATYLRSLVAGKLKQVQNKLPVDISDSTCFLTRPFDPVNYYCPIAGDGRVIEQPGLASMHTLFMREHNRLAEGLAKINTRWNDERVYQEARKINIGQWQNIVYYEFLPSILGYDVLSRFNLIYRGQNDNYNQSVDATISNAFAVAAFRYGHSQVHDVIGMLNSFNALSMEPLERHFFEPEWYHTVNGSGLENILKWVTSTRCPFTDNKIQDSIRLRLFQDTEGSSFDLAALNIHRGRDHGTPGYTAFRTLCGLSAVTHFGTGPGGLTDHDAQAARMLQSTYSCPGDIDLFPGLLTERRTTGSLLGPTWQCLLASEFMRLRDGDRFFYERSDRLNPGIGFTSAQLNSIKTVKTSDIICQNTKIRSMRPQAFLRPGRSIRNRPRNCYMFRGVDLSLWREGSRY